MQVYMCVSRQKGSSMDLSTLYTSYAILMILFSHHVIQGNPIRKYRRTLSSKMEKFQILTCT